jgi:hypothetical protein
MLIEHIMVLVLLEKNNISFKLIFKIKNYVNSFKNKTQLNFSAEMAERSNAPGLRPGFRKEAGVQIPLSALTDWDIYRVKK